MAVLVPNGDVLRRLRLQLRLDQEQRAPEERAGRPCESTRRGRLVKDSFAIFVRQHPVFVKPLIRPQSDTVSHTMHEDGGAQSLLQAAYAFVLGHHVAGVHGVLVEHGVVAPRSQLTLQLHPGLEHVEGVAEKGRARRRHSSYHEIHRSLESVYCCMGNETESA